jgi:hypothetical protein
MPALASIDDVETRLGRSLSVIEADRAEALLEDASALVVNYTGQKFVVTTSSNLLRIKGSKVHLAQRPAIEVTEVTDTEGKPLPYVWDGFQTVRVDCTSAPNQSHVVVTYEHGYEEVPGDVVAVVAGAAARTLSIPTEAASGISQQTVGPFSVSYANWAVGGQVMLSPEEKLTLKKYKTTMIGSIDVLGV